MTKTDRSLSFSLHALMDPLRSVDGNELDTDFGLGGVFTVRTITDPEWLNTSHLKLYVK